MSGEPKKPAPFNNPFGALSELRGELPVGESRSTSTLPKGPARAVVRMERKGHGGKEVTLVEQLALPAKELERWLKELKQSLGCGGTVDGDALVLQGDQRERVREALTRKGVRRISVG